MRVATYAMSQRLLTTTLRAQSSMAELQLQQASGSVATTYGGLGTSARSVVELESLLSRSRSYESTASEASGRIEIMYSSLSGVVDLLTNMRSTLTSALSTDGDTDTVSSLAESSLIELASLLNTRFEGRYLFSGDATGTEPVNLDGYSPDLTTASTSYYEGDSAKATVQLSQNQSVSYGITADNPAFETALRTLGSLAGATALDADAIQSAYDLIVEALDAVTSVQSQVSMDAATVERAQSRQQDYQTQLEAMVSTLKDADVTALAVELATYETQLEASYSAIAQLQSLNLVDYLR